MTKIYDDFFDQERFLEIKTLVDEELSSGIDQWRSPGHGEELVDLGLENSKLYRLEGPIKKLLISCFVENEFLKPETIQRTQDCLLRYHECKYPYHSLWHRDSTNDWFNESPDWFGFNFYLHNEWKPEYGGIFLYKTSVENQFGTFVEPVPNRLIFNDNDEWHSVTMVVDPSAIRKSLNLFVPYHLKR